jgi:hypothetical protein
MIRSMPSLRSWLDYMSGYLEAYGKATGYNLPSQFYRDLSWGGLQDTKFFLSMPKADQDRILDVIAVEQSGYDMAGNPTTQKGKPAGYTNCLKYDFN